MNSTEKEKGYNGYTNYETWNYALWMDNDEGTHSYMQELAQDAHDNPCSNQYMTLDRRRVSTLVGSIKAFIEEQVEAWMPDQASMFADLLNSALSSVNYYEIAEHYLGDIEDTTEKEG